LLIGEPPPTQGDVHFRLFGIPVRIHPFFWLVGVLLAAGDVLGAPNLRAGLGILLPWIVAFFVSILVHELGHALVIRAYGFAPWITLYGMGGLASYNPAHAYGSKGSDTKGQILISVAGPVAQLLLAGLVVVSVRLTGYKMAIVFGGPYGFQIAREMEPIGSEALTDLIILVVAVSIFWAILNLLPVYPLDGGKIAREIFLRFNPSNGIRLSLILSTITAGCLAAVALVVWGSFFGTFLFGFLAYENYLALQAYTGRGGWR
jgi:Zn-dependent protease